MIDLKNLAIDKLDADQLEDLRDSARALLAGIEQHLEWWNTPAHLIQKVRPFQFKEDGPVFYAEAVEDGVLINPSLPDGFDCTDNEERSPEERARWWMRPYIVADGWDEQEKFCRMQQERMQREDSEYAATDLEAYIAERRANWMAAWPSGTRYSVECLDGGAWDRPTSWGMFATLEAALACVNQRCA